jgi:sulfur transfer complex TusBCD TusB component (DsrH family)
VVFFVYRGGANTAVVLLNGENGFYASVQECTKLKQLKTNPDLLYALCYGITV